MTIRYYSSTAIETTLMAPITGSTTVISVAATTGFPGTTPFTLALDYESATNELVDVTMIAGTNLTVTRGVDGTSATSHNAGAKVRHVTSARDETDSRNHENASSNIHGLAPGDTIVGTNATQTLHNKTLDKATGDLQRVDIFNGPGWTTSVIGDSTDPTRSKLFIMDNETNLDALAEFTDSGQIFMRLRSDYTTGDVAFNIDTRKVSAGDKTLILGKTTSGNVFQVVDDGRINATQIGNFGPFVNIKASATNTSSIQRWLDSTGAVLGSVASDGRLIMNKGVSAEGAQGTSFIVFNVKGLAGQLANLQEWQNSAGTTLASVSPTGAATFASVTAPIVTSSLTNTGVGQVQTAMKSADLPRTNSTITNDPDLVLPVVANAVYRIDGWLDYNGQTFGSGPGDFKMDWTIPAGATLTYSRNGYINNSTNQVDTIVTDHSTIRSLGTFGTGTDISAKPSGVIRTAGTAGNLQLRWAQNTTTATATILRANSYITLTRVS